MLNDPNMLPILIGIGVIVVFGGIGLALSRSPGDLAEQRLAGLTGKRTLPSKKTTDPASGILARPAAIDLGRPSFWKSVVPNAESLNLLYEQADVNFPFKTFIMITVGLGIAGMVFAVVFSASYYLVPFIGLAMAAVPFFWLMRRRNKRIKQFVEAMPEAVELISRSLRAGHGLASGLHMVAEEMKGPIADEFNRVFEEQNLGIPIELSLRNMADRIPTMDVRFFVIAIVIQRATGGDLAEVLDKIGRMIRQRFELHGHVAGLTAEGRMSGLVLLAMPPSLLLMLYFLNYEYVSVFFTTPLGIKMLTYTAIGQFLGAIVIKKIIAIKV
jgi:tight adherence protein B